VVHVPKSKTHPWAVGSDIVGEFHYGGGGGRRIMHVPDDNIHQGALASSENFFRGGETHFLSEKF
jgi:hypothetical protein